MSWQESLCCCRSPSSCCWWPRSCLPPLIRCLWLVSTAVNHSAGRDWCVGLNRWEWVTQMERNDGGCFRDPENQDAANCIHHIHGYVSSRNGPLRNEGDRSPWNGPVESHPDAWVCYLSVPKRTITEENPSNNVRGKSFFILRAYI